MVKTVQIFKTETIHGKESTLIVLKKSFEITEISHFNIFKTKLHFTFQILCIYKFKLIYKKKILKKKERLNLDQKCFKMMKTKCLVGPEPNIYTDICARTYTYYLYE